MESLKKWGRFHFLDAKTDQRMIEIGCCPASSVFHFHYSPRKHVQANTHTLHFGIQKDPQSKRQPLFQNDAYRVVIFCFFGPLVVRIHTISIHHCLATSKHNSCIIYLSIINKAWHPILLLKESLPGFISWRYCEANIHLCSHKTLHTHHCLSWKIICLWASQELQPQILAKSPKRCQKSARPFIPPQCFHLIWKGRLLTSNMSIYLSFLPSTLSCLKSNSLYIAKNNLPNP